MILFLGIGVAAWTFVALDFAWSFLRRRSDVRGVFLLMALGWPTLLLRELHALPRVLTTPILCAGICAGLWSSAVLFVRWWKDPGVLE